MSRLDKLLSKLLRGTSDANFRFDDLRYVVDRLGFSERIVGGHHVFVRDDIAEQIVIQRRGKDAKEYQVDQVRRVVRKYRLGGES